MLDGVRARLPDRDEHVVADIGLGAEVAQPDAEPRAHLPEPLPIGRQPQVEHVGTDRLEPGDQDRDVVVPLRPLEHAAQDVVDQRLGAACYRPAVSRTSSSPTSSGASRRSTSPSV